MHYTDKYNYWLNSDVIDVKDKSELREIIEDITEIEDRFYQDLSFGTGGVRGVMGVGTNRMNKYVIRKVTQGLANFLSKKQNNQKSVAIAYDSRNHSSEFAMETALVLAANNINVYLFESLRPTPMLSYTVRKLGCSAGVVITASHNPAEYNGYKVYGSDGGQITLDAANAIISEVCKVDFFRDVSLVSEDEAKSNNLLQIIGNEIDEQYMTEVLELTSKEKIELRKDVHIVYTPLHGSGLMPVTSIFEKLNYNNVYLVDSQMLPNGDFPTVKSPNPEEREALFQGIQLAKNVEADIVLGTDPDCDRVGVAVRSSFGDYQLLTGNQIGALLTDYVLSHTGDLNGSDVVIKTIVTSELGAEIARAYGVTVRNTLTGFKFIGEKIKEFEDNKANRFLFGYEESFGYLAGSFVRDKDAVIACALVAEMTSYYKAKNKTLVDAMQQIYLKYGYYSESLKSIIMNGADGQNTIKQVVEKFRDLERLQDYIKDVKIVEDYQISERKDLSKNTVQQIDLPKSDVIKAVLNDGSWFAIRPSGTEPKLKIYYSAIGDTELDSKKRLAEISEITANFIK